MRLRWTRPTDYQEEVALNEHEQNNQIFPELKADQIDFESYERIFTGATTWNMALPQAVLTFLNKNNCAGKTVMPFNTHGGYGARTTFKQIEMYTKEAHLLEGLSVGGGEEINGVLLGIKGTKKIKFQKN